jgi:tRNA threonylcarbamoyladenosine modification (KEOPS) complex  Pcc1 subunit
MKAECILTIEFENAATAKKILQSITTDDQGFVKSSLKGNKLEATIQSKSVASLLHTLDDYLACVSVAKDIVDKK